MEGGIAKKKLTEGEKYFLLYAMFLILVISYVCVIGPFAVC